MILVLLFGGGMLGLYLFGFLICVGDVCVVWCGIGMMLLFIGWMVFINKGLMLVVLSVLFDFYYIGLIGNLVMFLVGYGMVCLFDCCLVVVV